eukprot:scaffold113977_cov28-Tisochrysis_lutea.AAC.8
MQAEHLRESWVGGPAAGRRHPEKHRHHGDVVALHDEGSELIDEGHGGAVSAPPQQTVAAGGPRGPRLDSSHRHFT